VSGPRRGVGTLPPKSLLADRARDFLAHGPADAATLVSHICQQATPIHIAEVIAAELLAGRPEFIRREDGVWVLAGAPAAAPRVSEAPPAAPPRPPSFEQWLARRNEQRAAAEAVAASAPPPPAEEYPAIRGTRRVVERPSAPATPIAGAPAPDEPLAGLSYVVVDVETTGGSPHAGHRITEFAAVVVRDGMVEGVYETLINPERVIPPHIVKLTGITAEMVRDKPTFREVCDAVVAALEGHVFVAHNVSFDWRFVAAEVERASGRRLDGPRLCTVRLARKMLPHLRSRSLGYVADWYGADAFAQTYFEQAHGRTTRPWRHSAAGDAVATAHCLIRMIRDAEARGCRTWGELEALVGAAAARRRARRRSAMPSPVDKDTTA
jgi:DNA polymerase III subunit epsilon